MTRIAIACLALAALLPIACAWIAKAGAFGARENHEPRAWLARQTGYRARAHAAQQNSWEGFPVFAAGLLAALWVGAPPPYTAALACVFIALRVLYIASYLADRATLRSLLWSAGFLASLALYGTARGLTRPTAKHGAASFRNCRARPCVYAPSVAIRL